VTDKDFIDSSVAMLIGGVAPPLAQSKTAMIRALQGSSGMACVKQPDEDKLCGLDRSGSLRTISPRDVARSEKTSVALDQICKENPAFSFIVDMQDRRLRRLADPGAACFPVFSFNRLPSDTQRVLWPLPKYHDLASNHFLATIDPGAVAWETKEPKLIWRGRTEGRAASKDLIRQEGTRLKAALKRYRTGALDLDGLREVVHSLPRFNALRHVEGDSRFDFGFIDGDGHTVAETPLHGPYARPRVSRQDMQRCKYIAVLRGLDVGSSFYWVMNSGSVGFVMETPFETFGSAHFKPWEHFIPFAEDCSDLKDRFEWAEGNQDACREMVARASEVSAKLARTDLRKAVLHDTVAALNDFQRAQ